MKKQFTLIFALALLLSGCTSYDTWNRTTTGMTLGAMFGSTVGGILGGNQGADAGMLFGGAVGGAVGAASAKSAEEKRRNESTQGTYPYGERRHERRHRHTDVEYGRYEEYDYAYAPLSQLEVNHVVFADANGNRLLEAGERAYVSFEIHNRGFRPVYNVAPIVVCDYKRIKISPTAIIGDLHPGETMRYKAVIVAKRNVRNRIVTFDIAFPDPAGNAVSHKTFAIRTIER